VPAGERAVWCDVQQCVVERRDSGVALVDADRQPDTEPLRGLGHHVRGIAADDDGLIEQRRVHGARVLVHGLVCHTQSG
jgi:hypothetical protein